MPDDLPTLIYSLGADGSPVVVVAGQGEIADRGALLARFPGLVDDGTATTLARIVNHFAREFRYDVIEDPAEFERAYRERLAAEDPGAPYEDNKPRLRNFGVPDFASIVPPRLEGGRLVYFAVDRFLGVPYRAEATVEGIEIGAPDYRPIELSPID